MNVDIFQFDSITDYLNGVFKQKKQVNPSFSLRSWCQQMEISSPGAFNQMMNGKRPFPKKVISKIADTLNLKYHEATYFKELYLQDDIEGPKKITKVLDKLNPRNWRAKKVTKDKEILSSPLFFAVKTLYARDAFYSGTFGELKDLFANDIEDNDIENVANMIKKHTQEIKSDKRLVTTTDVKDPKVQDIHSYYLELAKKRVHSVPVDEREYGNYSFNIDPKRIPELKERMRFFIDSVIEDFAEDKEGMRTYQLGSYLYPLDKEK